MKYKTHLWYQKIGHGYTEVVMEKLVLGNHQVLVIFYSLILLLVTQVHLFCRNKKTNHQSIQFDLCTFPHACQNSIQFKKFSKINFSFWSMGFETCLADTCIFKIYCIKFPCFSIWANPYIHFSSITGMERSKMLIFL